MNNVLQALIYFFKNVETHKSLQLDKKALLDELGQFGVSLADLEKTLSNMALWIASHSQTQPSQSPPSSQHSQTQSLTNYPTQSHVGLRIFAPDECIKLSKRSRGFLTKLEQMNILTSQMREKVIDQLMQIETTTDDQMVRLSHTKWVTFQTLFHDAPAAHVAYLEWLLFSKMIEVH